MARNPVQFQKGISLNEFLCRSMEPKSSASTPCTDGAGPTVSCARTAATTEAAS